MPQENFTDRKRSVFADVWFDFYSLFFPYVCVLCERGLARSEEVLCIDCLSALPRTAYASPYDNVITKKFTNRLPIDAGYVLFVFKKGNAAQRLIHLLKYEKRTDVGVFLGKQLGYSMRAAAADFLIPVPLHKRRLRERGYNQSLFIAEGISAVTGIPILADGLIRLTYSDSQTRKHRLDRWEGTQAAFAAFHPERVRGKNIVLIDDVLTTSATLEDCGIRLLEAGCLSLSIACLAHAHSYP